MNKELKNLTEKQDKEFDNQFVDWNRCSQFNENKTPDDIKTFIAKVRKETVEYERGRILKALPEEKNTEIKKTGSGCDGTDKLLNESFNECLNQVKQILKE